MTEASWQKPFRLRLYVWYLTHRDVWYATREKVLGAYKSRN